MTSTASLSRNGRRLVRPSAYSLLEMLISLLIIQIISSMVVYSVETINASSRLDLVTKRAIGAMRYARMLAMSTGQPCNVDFNVTSNTINVYLGASTTPVANSLFAGGQCSLNLISDQGVSGVTIGAVTNAATTPVSGATVYRCKYGSLGTRTNAPSYAQPMTVTFNFSGTSSTLTVPNAGDPN